MYLAPGQSRNIRSLFKDEYEGGFQMPTAASSVRVVIDPPDLATMNGEALSWSRPGSGTISGEIILSDGTTKPAEGTVALVCGDVPPAPQPVVHQPALQRTVLIDPDA